jgi:hypothetical protein
MLHHLVDEKDDRKGYANHHGTSLVVKSKANKTIRLNDILMVANSK